MCPVREKKTTELRECALWLTQAQAGLIRCTPGEYQATYRRFFALLTAWRVAGWKEPGLPGALPSFPARLAPEAPSFRKAA